MMLVLLTLSLVLILYISINYYKSLRYWKNKGVKYVTPIPIFGNSLPSVLQTKTLTEYIVDLYQKYPDERYCGTFQYGQPILLVRDLNLINRIFIKEFDTFSEHPIPFNSDDDALWEKNLFAASGERWKHLRQTISPVFTISKIKSMFKLMENCAKQLMEYLEEQGEDVVEIELRDIFKRYSANVIATIAFGIKCNSLKDRDNQFMSMGAELTNFGGIQKLKMLLYTINPLITKMLNLKMHPDEVVSFFRTMVKTTIDTREKQNIVRPDFIHHLLEARKGHLQDDDQLDLLDTEFAIAKESKLGVRNKQFSLELTDDDITAQALDFFYGGFYSTSSLMYFCLHELVVDPNIQEKLTKEVDDTLKQNEGEINYEALTKMKYLDMVISETLRKWPTAWIDRKSHKPITIEAEKLTEKVLHLESDSICWIPVFAIHRDSRYWPNPDKFDPERFSEKNRSKMFTSAFLPFGAGPRNCIGSRFAILEAKLVIFYILSRYEIVPIKKSNMVKDASLTSASTFWFGFKTRIQK